MTNDSAAPSTLTPTERHSLAALLELAIREDLGRVGDVTSLATIPADAAGKAAFVARQAGCLAGVPMIAMVLQRFDPELKFKPLLADGAALAGGHWIGTVEGSMRSILAAERTALNFVQHLSGVASRTRQFVEAIAGTKAQILDTRKTLPAWRLLDKYAVRAGGGTNHRIGLYDGVLIKDNHLAAMRKAEGGRRNEIEDSVQRCREAYPDLPIEIEVDSLEQFERALACGPAIVLLDNMTLDDLRTAVGRRDAFAPQARLEASGGVTLDTVRAIAETGVDRISVGGITHSAPALDIALDYLE